MKAFAKRLREIRESRDITQKQLAGLLRVQVALVSRYERGLSVPSAATIIELARILQVTTDELLLGSTSATEAPLIRHAALLDRFRHLDEEIQERKDLDAIMALMDAFLAKKRIEKFVTA